MFNLKTGILSNRSMMVYHIQRNTHTEEKQREVSIGK